MGGLSQQTGAEELRSYFEVFGEVKEAFIKVDPVTNRGRGFGFVTFSEPDAIDRLVKHALLAMVFKTSEFWLNLCKIQKNFHFGFDRTVFSLAMLITVTLNSFYINNT